MAGLKALRPGGGGGGGVASGWLIWECGRGGGGDTGRSWQDKYFNSGWFWLSPFYTFSLPLASPNPPSQILRHFAVVHPATDSLPPAPPIPPRQHICGHCQLPALKPVWRVKTKQWTISTGRLTTRRCYLGQKSKVITLDMMLHDTVFSVAYAKMRIKKLCRFSIVTLFFPCRHIQTLYVHFSTTGFTPKGRIRIRIYLALPDPDLHWPVRIRFLAPGIWQK